MLQVNYIEFGTFDGSLNDAEHEMERQSLVMSYTFRFSRWRQVRHEHLRYLVPIRQHQIVRKVIWTRMCFRKRKLAGAKQKTTRCKQQKLFCYNIRFCAFDSQEKKLR